ncbi:MAG TPA: tyrosine-type recombinase/integrase [Verrucomicrobiae bacterium]|nr:tyrosine-type recombinase/integrase [Verrucomicrobiae bacterium]
MDGLHNGERVRGSLKTRSRQTAERRLAERIRKLDAQFADENRNSDTAGSGPCVSPATAVTVAEASKRFLKTHGEIGPDGKFRGDSEHGTWRKYQSGLRFLEAYCEHSGIVLLADVPTEVLEEFRSSRNIGKVTWKVERQMLVTFFGYCVRKKWIATNPAKELKSPRNLKPNEVVPYTFHEESQILAACDQIGGGRYHRSGANYEQLRARAMVMLLRHTALRVSDVCTLRKDAISWDQENATWRVLLRTQKSAEPVFLPIPEGLKLLLDALPLPRNAPQDCPCYFRNGSTSPRAAVGIAERTLAAVFQKSAVKNAHAHRYRHTLATRLLEQGATFEQVADILGNSPEVVRKHYGKWSKGRQANIDRLMMAHFETAAVTNPVTKKSYENSGAIN